MSGPTFVRLIDGRLWHTAPGADLQITSCGRAIDWPDDDRQPEVLDGIVPVGAWTCARCRAALAEWLRAVDQAIAADPRGRRTEPLPVASEGLTSLAEEVRVSRETPTPEPVEPEAHLTEVPF